MNLWRTVTAVLALVSLLWIGRSVFAQDPVTAQFVDELNANRKGKTLVIGLEKYFAEYTFKHHHYAALKRIFLL